jgi:tRNA threonylcarbamoyladenosine biosynthesis protein TsaB
MNLLAIELSTEQKSLAFFQDSSPVAERQWTEENHRHQNVFQELGLLLREIPVGLEEIDTVAVGRGPGHYSGMRVGLAMAQGLAQPGQARVLAISSGAALALEVFTETSAPDIAIIGDARRQKIWMGLFAARGGGLQSSGDWKLLDPASIGAMLPPGAVVVTSQRARLAHLLPAAVAATLTGNRYPHASWLGRLALDHAQRGLPSDPLTPLYLHPAV